jgi:hypothetical protein
MKDISKHIFKKSVWYAFSAVIALAFIPVASATAQEFGFDFGFGTGETGFVDTFDPGMGSDFGFFESFDPGIGVGETGSFDGFDSGIGTGETGTFDTFDPGIGTGEGGTFEEFDPGIGTGEAGTFEEFDPGIGTGEAGTFEEFDPGIGTGEAGTFEEFDPGIGTGEAGTFTEPAFGIGEPIFVPFDPVMVFTPIFDPVFPGGGSIIIDEEDDDDDRREFPSCNIFVGDNTLTRGQSTRLTWTTANADNVSISGIGAVSRNGSITVSPLTSTTYVLTAANTRGSVNCIVSITVISVVQNAPVCDAFTVSPSRINNSGTVTLSWNTTNATNVSINNGIGPVSVDGNINVRVTDDTTFTLTASNAVDTVTCQASVDVDEDDDDDDDNGGGGSASLRCRLTASDTNIRSGERVTLRWRNTGANDMILRERGGDTLVDTRRNRDRNFDEDADSLTVHPNRTTTYVLTAIRGSRERECRVTINMDRIEVTSVRSQDMIPLAAVPYTGFEAGPVLTFIFYAAIVLWGLAVAYALVMKKTSVARTTSAPLAVSAVSAPYYEETASADSAPANLPVDEETEEMLQVEEDKGIKALEEYAHANYALISSDALRFIQSQGGTTEEQIQTLAQIISLAKARYPKEGDWIVLNKERVLSLLS